MEPPKKIVAYAVMSQVGMDAPVVEEGRRTSKQDAQFDCHLLREIVGKKTWIEERFD